LGTKYVPINAFNAELVRCRPWIEAALDRCGGTHIFEDIVQGVLTGNMQLWPAEDAAAITEIVVFPRKKILNIFLAGGNMDTIVDMNESAAAFAKANGCDALTIAGRRGWARVLLDHGWSAQFTTLTKEI
jgi:hypothetical protein